VAPPPPPDAPAIACPANVAVSGVTGGSRAVTYPPPVATGGVAPLTVVCTPVSGSVFVLGTTPVFCSVTDARGQFRQCTFSVTLTGLLLSVTRFLAFGDSFTEGENGQASSLGSPIVDVASAYPTKLRGLLNAEFSGAPIVVTARGVGGETAEAGLARLPGVLAAERPGALLLLEGYNNLTGPCPPGAGGTAACAAAISTVVTALRGDIRVALAPSTGVRFVFVSTLTPPGPVVGSRDRRIAADAIVLTNSLLAPTIRAEGATLVNPHPLFVGHESQYVGDDGLHLRPPGYQVLAETFFAAIKATIPATTGIAFARRPE
jgi:lysophospholipase L1-like esterase